MKLHDAFLWLCANLDTTNERRQANGQGDCWKLLHIDGDNQLDVLHVPTGAVFRFTVEQIGWPT